MDDGSLVCAAEEERFSRRKHDASFPALAIDFCLRTAAESGRPIDYVAFYEQPSTKFRRVLTTAAAMGKPAEDAFVRSMRAWRTERRGIRGRLSALARVPAERVLFTDHHVSHAASAFFPSPFESAAVMTIDGVGEWSTATVGRASSTGGRHVAPDRVGRRLPSLARPLLLGPHRPARLRGQRGRVQGDGNGALRGAALPRRARAGAPPLRRRQLLARPVLLLVPLLDQAGLLRRAARAARRRAEAPERALLDVGGCGRLAGRPRAESAVRRHRRERPGDHRTGGGQPRPRGAAAQRARRTSASPAASR